MKRLQNTLYITTPDSYLALEGQNIIVLQNKLKLGRVPLHNLESVVTFGRSGASPALMHACMENNISLVFLSGHGRFLGRVIGPQTGNVVLRKQQYGISQHDKQSTLIARNFIIGKLYNQRWMIERATRDHGMRIDVSKFKRVSLGLKGAISELMDISDLETLRGKEGQIATQYFSIFDDLILQQKDYFYYHGRNRRPPLDNINALLSFTYTLLANDTASALETVGLDPYVGFMHQDRPGRASLALDLMEELRGILADRFVLNLVNKKILKPTDFNKKESGAVLLSDDARKKLIQSWQDKKQKEIEHPFLKEKINWGLVPYAQSLLLSRFLRGDLDEYPPFLWK